MSSCRYTAIYLLIFLLVAALAPAQDDEPTSPTRRIITASPNVAEIVFALGAGNQVVGVSRYTDYPPEAAALPKIGDLYTANLELILQLQPTDIIAIPGNEKIIEYFNDRPGVDLLVTGEIEKLSDINEATLLIGEKLGFDSQARELVAENERLVAEARAATADREPLKVLIVVGRSAGLAQLYAAGQETYLTELIELAGGRNVVPADLGRYPVLNKEALLRYDPDVIIEFCGSGDVEACYEEALGEWRRLSMLDVVKRGDIRFVADEGVLKPGPRSAGYEDYFRRLLWETKPGSAPSP